MDIVEEGGFTADDGTAEALIVFILIFKAGSWPAFMRFLFGQTVIFYGFIPVSTIKQGRQVKYFYKVFDSFTVDANFSLQRFFNWKISPILKL